MTSMQDIDIVRLRPTIGLPRLQEKYFEFSADLNSIKDKGEKYLSKK
jgi:hypothetical protein